MRNVTEKCVPNLTPWKKGGGGGWSMSKQVNKLFAISYDTLPPPITHNNIDDLT